MEPTKRNIRSIKPGLGFVIPIKESGRFGVGQVIVNFYLVDKKLQPHMWGDLWCVAYPVAFNSAEDAAKWLGSSDGYKPLIAARVSAESIKDGRWILTGASSFPPNVPFPRYRTRENGKEVAVDFLGRIISGSSIDEQELPPFKFSSASVLEGALTAWEISEEALIPYKDILFDTCMKFDFGDFFLNEKLSLEQRPLP